MNRRTYIGLFATGSVCVAGVGLAYQLDQGNISLGDSSEVSGSVSGSSDTFEFDVEAGVEIRVSVTDTGDAPYSGSFSLYDPAGTEVLEGGPRSTDLATETHTAERSGTYRLEVNPQRTRLNVAVHLENGTE